VTPHYPTPLVHEIAGTKKPDAMSPRNTHRYVLRDGRRIVQFGITNGALDRAAEHLRAGKRFTSMGVVGPAVTRDSALDWERDQIESYQRTHRGRRPRYNKV
jgi:hypothetical protein